MPTYSFHCEKCGNHDQVVKLEPPKYDPPTELPCVKCGKPADRVFTAPMINTPKGAGVRMDTETGETARTLTP
jgi:putative FmdB family regulatory protein